MCGPSQQEQGLSTDQSNFYSTLTNEYNTVFGQNQQLTGALTNAFLPILQQGPSQTGFSPSEENALTTQNIEGTATDYAQAQQATAATLAARGGGNTFLPSSVNANLLAQNANAAAAQRATAQNQITLQNYQQGQQNWQTAAGVLSNTASMLNPTSYAGTALNAGNAAFGSASTLAQQAYAPWSAAFGALGSIGGMAAGNYMQGLGLGQRTGSTVPTAPLSMYGG